MTSSGIAKSYFSVLVFWLTHLSKTCTLLCVYYVWLLIGLIIISPTKHENMHRAAHIPEVVQSGAKRKSKRMSSTRVRPLSWLLSNNRLEEVCGTLTKGTSSSRLLLSNQDKGCTQCWSESGLGLGLNGWVRVRVRTRTLVLWTRTRTPPLGTRTQALRTRTLVLWIRTRTRIRTPPRWTRTHSESRWVRWEIYIQGKFKLSCAIMDEIIGMN